MIFLIYSNISLPTTLVDIITHYLNLEEDNYINRIQMTAKAYLSTMTIPFYKEKARNYKIKITKDFLDALWKEEAYTALKTLQAGASYFLNKEEILKLAKNNKYIALHIFMAQISFERKRSLIKFEVRYEEAGWNTKKKMKRSIFKISYLDESAKSIANAYHDSENQKSKNLLLTIYRKYKNVKDSNEPALTSTEYSDWELAKMIYHE